MLQFKCCGLGDELGQKLLRDPRPEVHHRLPALRDPPGEEGPVLYVVLHKCLTANQFHPKLGIFLETSEESLPSRFPCEDLDVVVTAHHSQGGVPGSLQV